ncbi:MAG: glycosyltransferase family 39 protein [Tepidisphaeraceae bacterium]
MSEAQNDSSTGATRALLLALVLLSLALRLGWAWTRPSDAASIAALPDQVEYLQVADSIRAGNGVAMIDTRFPDAGEVRAFRMPGYPAVIALLNSNARAVRVVQAVLGATTVLAGFWLARRFIGPRAALVAGVFVAFDPLLVYFDGLVLTESLFVTMSAWALALLAYGSPPTLRASGGATPSCGGLASRCCWRRSTYDRAPCRGLS